MSIWDEIEQEGVVTSVWDDIETEFAATEQDEQEASYAKQALGGLVRMGMNMGQAVLEMPKHFAWMAMKIEGRDIGAPPKPGDKGYLLYKEQQEKIKADPSYKPLGVKHMELIAEHKRGVESILKAHPEWESEPPENFLDLLTSPRKLSLAIIESGPLLVAAGVLTVAGQPHIAAALIYGTEGQEAHDLAIADGATNEQAEQAYHLYGSVATLLESLQLQGMLKFGKKSYQTILHRTVQKIAKKGTKSLTRETVKEVGTQAIQEMAQGTWGELTAKIVYDKSIPGGLWDFIDRRAQEGLIAGTMGLIPGMGGATLARSRNLIDGISQRTDISPEESTEVIAGAVTQVDPKAPPAKQQQQLKETILEEITITKIVSRFPQRVTDQKSLEEVGNAIAVHLGIDIEAKPITWVHEKRQGGVGVGGAHRKYQETVTISVGTVSKTTGQQKGKRRFAGMVYKKGQRMWPSQGNIKRTIIHELGHIAKPPIFTETGRRLAHTPEFAAWVEENVKQLFEEKKITRRVPVEVEAPVTEEPVPVLEEPITDKIAKKPQGSNITTPSRTYTEATKSKLFDRDMDKNILIRNTTQQDNKGRTLLVQFNSDLLTPKEDARARAYYDTLYAMRKDYNRPADFWEVPQWVGEMAHIMPDSDVYVVRDMGEAKQFLAESGYYTIAFSALEVNKNFIKELSIDFPGNVIVGGYMGKRTFNNIPNIKWYDSIEAVARDRGIPYEPGVDFRHFEGTETIPRLCMSKGCLHKCAFCVVPKGVTEVSEELIDKQIDAMAKFKTSLVYIDDKTFGQAKNYKLLPEFYRRIKVRNPEFNGFIVQTTASQMTKFTDEFLKESGIKYIELGIETYNNPILRALHKPASEKSIDRAVEKIRKNKINFIPNIMIGLPGESTGSYQQTLDFLQKNADIISHVNIYNLALYKGTELSEILKAESETDTDETAIKKSFHDNPAIVNKFTDDVYSLASSFLEKEVKLEEEVRKIGKKKALILGHRLPGLLKMDEGMRRSFMEKTTGKRSMKDMSLEEMRTYVAALEELVEAEGLALEAPIEETIEAIKLNNKKTVMEGIKGLEEKGIKAFFQNFRKGFTRYIDGLYRIERFTELLDGFEEGPNYNNIFIPVTKANMSAIEAKRTRIETAIEKFWELHGGNKEAVMRLVAKESQHIADKTDDNPAIDLAPMQRLAVYIYAKNKDGLHHLQYGNFVNFKDFDTALRQIAESMSNEERAIGDWIIEDMNNQFPRVRQAVILALGRDITQQDNYFSLYLRDVDPEFQTDFLDELLKQAGEKTYIPEPGEVKARKRGAKQALRLDAFENYFYHINQIEQFINLAPIAKSVGDIINDKEYQRAVNEVTDGHGGRILKDWLRHSLKGYASEQSSWLGKGLLMLRRNGIVYAIGGNIPSVLRQQLSGFNAMSVHPAVAYYAARHWAEGKNPAYYRKLENRTMQKSKMMRTRNFDRIQIIINKQNPARRRILHKKPWSSKALSWIQWMDKHTTVYSWNAFYDAALDSGAAQKTFGLDGSEQAAINFADKWVGRTQPMGGVEHLPDFFRGGTVERLLTTFQNQINNNFNFWYHDIYQARKYGKIDNTLLMYRVMLSYVLPALAFGMIGRGGLPRTWKDVPFDLFTYMLGPVFLFGRIIYNAIHGFTTVGGIESIGIVETEKTINALIRGDMEQAARHGVRAVGATTGLVPAQAIRTTEGVIDLMTDKTSDLRRLVYSKWSLEQGKPKKEKAKPTKREF